MPTLSPAGDNPCNNEARRLAPYVRNVETVNAHFMVTYLIAKGQPRRIDQPAPTCAAALGLE
jgi:hypothetical protein